MVLLPYGLVGHIDLGVIKNDLEEKDAKNWSLKAFRRGHKVTCGWY